MSCLTYEELSQKIRYSPVPSSNGTCVQYRNCEKNDKRHFKQLLKKEKCMAKQIEKMEKRFNKMYREAIKTLDCGTIDPAKSACLKKKVIKLETRFEEQRRTNEGCIALKEARVNGFKDRVCRLKYQNGKLKTKNKQLNCNITELKDQLPLLTYKKQKKEAEHLEELNNYSSSLEEDLENYRNVYNSAMEKHQTEVALTRNRLTRTLKNKIHMEREIKEFTEAVPRLTQTIENMRFEHIADTERIEFLKEQIKQLDAEIEEKKEQGYIVCNKKIIEKPKKKIEKVEKIENSCEKFQIIDATKRLQSVIDMSSDPCKSCKKCEKLKEELFEVATEIRDIAVTLLTECPNQENDNSETDQNSHQTQNSVSIPDSESQYQ